jgi:L-2-hydroxyglutarate oxidase
LTQAVPSDVDTVVVGGGIVGLAVANALLRRRPSSSIAVLEKEDAVARHQSGHNSGVIHSGIYYRPGSRKAELCVEGARRMFEYCDDKGIPVRRCGKLIVATRPEELPRLDDLASRAEVNGLRGVSRHGPDGIREIEPHARGLAALHVPATAVVDFRRVAGELVQDLVAAGATVATDCDVTAIESKAAVTVRLRNGDGVRARRAVVCAGLQGDRLAPPEVTGGVRIVPFRGSYYEVAPAAARRVRALIYPVPDPRFPFLGVHFSRHIDDSVSCGPNAVLALAREKYERRAFDRRDAADVIRFRGMWNVARRYWASGAKEVARDLSKRLYLREARRYLDDVSAADLEPGGTGIRAQAVDRAGTLLDDFVFARDGHVLHVLNTPSPAATASLAIADAVADMVDSTT